MRLPVDPHPRITVVMPTYRRKASLERTLRALALQVYPAHLVEVILVCDGGNDGSAEMALGLRLPFALTVLEQDNAGPAAARNLALAHAQGPLIVFIDDDVIPYPQLLAEHAAAHADSEDRVVIGPLLPPQKAHSPWVRWELRTVLRQYDEMDAGMYRAGPRQFYTGNASVRLERLRAVGGFDTKFRRAEDVELAFRLQACGMRFIFHRNAGALHMAERSLESWLRAGYEYGRNDMVIGFFRGRPDMLRAVAEEFHQRNWLTRALVSATVPSPRIQAALARALGEVSRVALAAGGGRLAVSLCSAAFALSYWRGVGAGLGSPGAVRRFMEGGRDKAKGASADAARDENALSSFLLLLPYADWIADLIGQTSVIG